MPRIELSDCHPDVPFAFALGDAVRTRSTGPGGRVVAGRYLGPMPPAGVAFPYAIAYQIRPDGGPEFEALAILAPDWALSASACSSPPRSRVR